MHATHDPPTLQRLSDEIITPIFMLHNQAHYNVSTSQQNNQILFHQEPKNPPEVPDPQAKTSQNQNFCTINN